VAAIPSVFAAPHLQSGELIELPLQPLPLSIVVSMCRSRDPKTMAHAAPAAIITCPSARRWRRSEAAPAALGCTRSEARVDWAPPYSGWTGQ